MWLECCFVGFVLRGWQERFILLKPHIQKFTYKKNKKYPHFTKIEHKHIPKWAGTYQGWVETGFCRDETRRETMPRREKNSRQFEKIVIYLNPIRDIIETKKMYLETIREKRN